MSKKDEGATMTVEAAAKKMNIGRAQAYQAAHNKQIPTIRIGKRILVLTKPLERMLAGETDKNAEAVS